MSQAHVQGCCMVLIGLAVAQAGCSAASSEVRPCGFTTSSQALTTLAQGYPAQREIDPGAYSDMSSVSFSLETGALPPGLDIVEGQLRGTPTDIGSYRFMIRATAADASCRSVVSTALSINVQLAECDTPNDCTAIAYTQTRCVKSTDCPKPNVGGSGYCVMLAKGRNRCIDDGTVYLCGDGTQTDSYTSVEGNAFNTCGSTVGGGHCNDHFCN